MERLILSCQALWNETRPQVIYKLGPLPLPIFFLIGLQGLPYEDH